MTPCEWSGSGVRQSIKNMVIGSALNSGLQLDGVPLGDASNGTALTANSKSALQGVGFWAQLGGLGTHLYDATRHEDARDKKPSNSTPTELFVKIKTGDHSSAGCSIS